MSVGGVDLNLLITLRALLEEENVTHAGSRLGLSQPSMSIALGRLRRHYKDELLVRNGRDYCLTPLARALLPSVTESLRLVDVAFGRIQTFVPGKSDQVFSLTLSDYAVTVLIEPLLRRVHEEAPMVGLKLSPIPPDMQESDRGLREHDLLIGPLGFAFPGESEVLFRDRWVCIVDPANPRLRDGWLSLEDIGALPHAAASLGHSGLNPADRVLDELGVRRRVQVKVAGWLPLPFVVAGTDLVAIVPERLARRVASTAGVLVVEPPFGHLDLIEAAWWHPARSADPALGWLRGVLKDTATDLVLRFPLMGDAPGTSSTASQRVAVVTGGAGAIGGAIAAALAAAGHTVVSLDQAADPPVDLASDEQVRAAAAAVLGRHGRCDVLVHAAAAFDKARLADLDLTAWRRVQAVNVEAALLLAQAFVPGMAERGFGRIVFIVSDTVWSPPAGDMLPYVTSKGALIALARVLAVGHGRDGIAVTCVAPGLTDTPAARADQPTALFDDVRSRQALPRTLVPGDVAATVAFLASDGAAALTGQTLCVDGGLVLR